LTFASRQAGILKFGFNYLAMDKEKKPISKPLRRFIVIAAYSAGIIFILILITGYWLSSPYTLPEPTSRFISKEADGFISINFDPDNQGLSEVSSLILRKILKAEKKSLVSMNMPSQLIQFLESDEQGENIKLFLPYEIGYLFSFKKDEEKPSQIVVVNLRYFKNFFKLLLRSFPQPKIRLSGLNGEDSIKTLLLYPAYPDSSNSRGKDFLTLYANNIIYLTSEKLFRASVEAYRKNRTPFYEKPEVKDFYNRLILSEDISFVADNREDSLSRLIEWVARGNESKAFFDIFDIIDIMAGNVDVKRNDVITGLIYLNLKKMYSEQNLQEKVSQLKMKLGENFPLNIDFQLERTKNQDCYILKFKCLGLARLIMKEIDKGSS